MFITLYIIIRLFLALNKKEKKTNKLYVASHKKTAAYSRKLYAAVFGGPLHIVFHICCGSLVARSIWCPFLLRFKTAAFKIGYLLLSLMLGPKTAAYYGQKTAANKVFFPLVTLIELCLSVEIVNTIVSLVNFVHLGYKGFWEAVVNKSKTLGHFTNSSSTSSIISLIWSTSSLTFSLSVSYPSIRSTSSLTSSSTLLSL